MIRVSTASDHLNRCKHAIDQRHKSAFSSNYFIFDFFSFSSSLEQT